MKTRRHTTDSSVTLSVNEGVDTLSSIPNRKSTTTSPARDVIRTLQKSDVWKYFERYISTGLF